MDDHVTAAHDALARHDFEAALATLREADREGGLSPHDLMLMSEAAWWSGDADVAVDVLERAFAAFQAAGRPTEAALAALRLSNLAITRLAFAIAGGWLARAERLLAEEPESAAHAWLALMHAALAIYRYGDLDATARHADRAIELARAHGSGDVESLALGVRGYVLVHQGSWAEGLAMIDEAAAAALSGALQPRTACDVYCITIATCRDLADYRRAGEWTDEADRWMQRHTLRGYRGVCRTHRAELKRLRGAWPEAEREAREACAELEAFHMFEGVGHAHYEVGEVRLRMGDLAAAEEAFGRAHEFGREPQPGWSSMLLARGKTEEALASIARAVAATDPKGPGGPPTDLLRRSQLLPAHVEIALASGDVAAAEASADELESLASRYESAALEAAAVTARGSVELVRGAADDAVRTLSRAWRLWQTIDLPFESARARVALGSARAAAGEVETAELEWRAARGTFERLGATLDLHRVNDLLRGAAERSGRSRGRVTRTFMFTDIVASTDLVRHIGDTAWERLIDLHDRTLRSEIARHRGEEVRHTGDGFFAAFVEARDAVACAVAILQRLAERREDGYLPSVRIGLHTAEASRHGLDYAGHGVHVAARIAQLARDDEIVASRGTVDGAAPLRVVVGDERSVALKGVADEVEVVAIAWR